MSNYGVSIKIEDEKGFMVLDTKASVPEHVYKYMMQQFGFYIEEQKPVKAIMAPFTRVRCKFREVCIESSDKCKECFNNEAKSYFVQK